MDDIHEAAIGHVNRAWEWFAGMVALSATNLGIELGMFDLLEREGPLRPGEIAERLGLQPRAIDLWAKTLVQYELLTVAAGETVGLAPGVELMVCGPQTLFNLQPSFAYHARFLARDFLDLPQFFQDGKPIGPERHGEALSRNVAEQTAMMHAVFTQAMIPELPGLQRLLEDGAKVLDAGCGQGDLGLLLCSAFPFVQYVGVDLDGGALSRGRGMAAELKLGSRFELREGDLTTAGLQADFDLAILFLALHEIPEGTRSDVLKAIRRALKAGARLIIFDETYPESLTEAAMRGARMGLHFEYTELLWGSHVPTRTELSDLLGEAGFTGMERLPMLDGSFDVVVARA